MVGILVHGDNHFIVRGPFPDRETALMLARHWSLIQIGQTTPAALVQWSISTREFRENPEWAVVIHGDGEIAPAVAHASAGIGSQAAGAAQAEPRFPLDSAIHKGRESHASAASRFVSSQPHKAVFQ